MEDVETVKAEVHIDCARCMSRKEEVPDDLVGRSPLPPRELPGLLQPVQTQDEVHPFGIISKAVKVLLKLRRPVSLSRPLCRILYGRIGSDGPKLLSYTSDASGIGPACIPMQVSFRIVKKWVELITIGQRLECLRQSLCLFVQGIQFPAQCILPYRVQETAPPRLPVLRLLLRGSAGQIREPVHMNILVCLLKLCKLLRRMHLPVIRKGRYKQILSHTGIGELHNISLFILPCLQGQVFHDPQLIAVVLGIL